MDILKLMNKGKSHPQGFTVDLQGNHITTGFAVARLETQNSHGEQGAARVLAYATENNCYIGGWLDTETNKYYFDAVDVYTSESQAIAIAIKREQIAVYDLEEDEEIRL